MRAYVVPALAGEECVVHSDRTNTERSETSSTSVLRQLQSIFLEECAGHSFSVAKMISTTEIEESSRLERDLGSLSEHGNDAIAVE